MASNDVTERILDLLNQSPDALDALQRVLRTFSSVTVTPPDPGELFLTNQDEYLKLMMGSMEHAIFPRAMRPAFSVFAGVTTRESAWNWVAQQVRTNVVDATWAHASNLSKLVHAFFKDVFRDGSMQISHLPHAG